MRTLTAFTVAFIVASTALGSAVLAESPRLGPNYLVIVHPTSSAPSFDRKFIEDAFLKKISRWPNGDSIRPVDQGPDSPIRRKFTEDVLNRTVAAVKGYWQQRIFSGRDVPPPEVDTDEQVIGFVLQHEGAIGYVSGNADVKGSTIVGLK